MAKRSDILPYRIFVGGRPWEELTPEEKDAFGQKVADRMGRVFNDYFSQHPEVYQKFKGIEECE